MSRHFSSNQHLPQPEKIKQNVSESHDKRTIHNNKDICIYRERRRRRGDDTCEIGILFFFVCFVSRYKYNNNNNT
jgi:hypothetical protein